MEINIQQTSRLTICIPCVLYRLIVVFILSEIRADLLAMVHFPHSLMYRVILGSVTESVVNHLELPVVSLPATVSEEEMVASTLDE